MGAPSTEEMREILERARKLFDASGEEYLDGVIAALGWVLGEYDDPLEE